MSQCYSDRKLCQKCDRPVSKNPVVSEGASRSNYCVKLKIESLQTCMDNHIT